MIDRWTAVFAELERMRSLKDDWDGEGTLAPEAPIIEAAISNASDMQSWRSTPPDRVYVSVNGTIYFEWDWGVGYYEMEFVSPEETECRFVDKAKLEASHV